MASWLNTRQIIRINTNNNVALKIMACDGLTEFERDPIPISFPRPLIRLGIGIVLNHWKFENRVQTVQVKPEHAYNKEKDVEQHF